MIPTPPLPFTNPKVRQLVAYFILGMIAAVIVLFGVGAVLGLPVEDPLWIMLIYIGMFIGLSGWLWKALAFNGIAPQWVIGQVPRSPRWGIWIGVMLGVLVFSFASFVVLMGGLSYVAPAFVSQYLRALETDTTTNSQYPGLYQLVLAIAALIVAPITEEWLFRGFILQRWSVKWNLPVALVVSSILFGCLHSNPIGLTMFGLVMGVLYVKTRSLVVAIGAHGFNNAIAFGLPLLVQNPTPTTLEVLRRSLPVGMFLTFTVGAGLLWYLWKNFPRKETLPPYVANAEAIHEI